MTVKQWVNYLGPTGLEKQDLGGAVKEKLAGLESWPPRGQGEAGVGNFQNSQGICKSILNIQIDIHFSPFRSVCWYEISLVAVQKIWALGGKWWETGLASGALVKSSCIKAELLIQLRRKRVRRDLHRTQWKLSTIDKEPLIWIIVLFFLVYLLFWF